MYRGVCSGQGRDGHGGAFHSVHGEMVSNRILMILVCDVDNVNVSLFFFLIKGKVITKPTVCLFIG